MISYLELSRLMKRIPPALRVDVVIEDGRWHQIEFKAIATDSCAASLKAVGHQARGHEIAILASSDARITELNDRYRGQKIPTNVLAWPAPKSAIDSMTTSEERFLGDIALAWETCVGEADASGRSISAHVSHLIVHGCLHLVGFHHRTDTETEKMQNLETIILATLGIISPYDGVKEAYR